MKVADLLHSRRDNWRELDELCGQLETSRRRKLNGAAATRFAALYRGACADLALAEAYQLPPNMISYLHRLVGRAHNQLYRSNALNFKAWRVEMLDRVPQRLFADRFLWLAFALFWGLFLFSMVLAAGTQMPFTGRPLVSAETYTERILGKPSMEMLTSSFSKPLGSRSSNENMAMAGFYIFHNAGIGLKCFAFGLLLGIGGLFATVFNGAYLGAAFGYMLRTDNCRDNFFQFVTAHGPFELTAIILSAAAGMRLGFALVDTGGFARIDSLVRAGREVMPIAGTGVVLFCLAALLEGFVSPSGLPYAIKAVFGAGSAALLVTYLVLLGWPRDIQTTGAGDSAEPVEAQLA